MQLHTVKCLLLIVYFFWLCAHIVSFTVMEGFMKTMTSHRPLGRLIIAASDGLSTMTQLSDPRISESSGDGAAKKLTCPGEAQWGGEDRTICLDENKAVFEPFDLGRSKVAGPRAAQPSLFPRSRLHAHTNVFPAEERLVHTLMMCGGAASCVGGIVGYIAGSRSSPGPAADQIKSISQSIWEIM